MKSFEHGYFYEMPISHGLVSSIGLLGEFKGREGLYTQQYPEVLDTRALRFAIRRGSALRWAWPECAMGKVGTLT